MKNKVIAGTLVTLFSVFWFTSSSFASYQVENQNESTSTYEYVVDKLDNTLDSVKSFIIPSASASISWITYNDWVVTFNSATDAAINKGMSNALGNLWAWFLLILPYLWTALWIMLVIWVIMMLAKRGWRW